MIRSILFIGVVLCMLMACNPSGKGLFKTASPHERYGRQLNEAGLSASSLATAWFTAATRSLAAPVEITLPFNEKGYFDKAEPSGNGYRFRARKGQILNINLAKKPLTGFRIFTELWHLGDSVNGDPSLLQSVDTSVIKQEIDDDGIYILRMQPELLASVEYELKVFITPSLAFPVSAKEKTTVASFWGDTRDAGARNHEGIDIFGSLRSPVVAAADATVSRVGTNNLGGNIIFLRPQGKNYSLYYAHLDSQLVQTGDRVTAGQLIGLMGKTGNARNTPVHLHFGIYTSRGAVDPLPFVKAEAAMKAVVFTNEDLLNRLVVNGKRTTITQSPLKKSNVLLNAPANTLMRLIAISDKLNKVRLPDGREGYLDPGSIKGLSRKETVTLKNTTIIKDAPLEQALTKGIAEAGKQLNVLGYFNEHYYFENDGSSGWVNITGR